MRLLLIAPILPPEVGGAANYYHRLICDLEKENKVFIITSSNYQDRKNVKVYKVLPLYNKYKKNILTKLFFFAYSFFIVLLSTIYLSSKHKVDFVQSHSSMAYGYASLIATFFVWKKYILDIRDMTTSRKIWNILSIIKKPDIIIHVDDESKGYYNRINPKRWVKFPVIPFFDKEIPIYIDFEFDKNKKIFLFIGKIEERKGIKILLEAFKNLKNEYLIIAGDGTLEKYVKIFIKKNKLCDRIIYLGKVEHNQIPSLLKRADALILPSFTESSPRIIYEAFMFNLPVLASNVGNIPNIIEENKNGLLIQRLDYKAIIFSINKFLEIQELFTNINKNIDRKRTAKKIGNIYLK